MKTSLTYNFNKFDVFGSFVQYEKWNVHINQPFHAEDLNKHFSKEDI